MIVNTVVLARNITKQWKASATFSEAQGGVIKWLTIVMFNVQGNLQKKAFNKQKDQELVEVMKKLEVQPTNKQLTAWAATSYVPSCIVMLHESVSMWSQGAV